jgi:uncharacterized membrane protein YcaP (DUF421 family)
MSTVVRLVVMYVFIVAGLRVLGKREFSQLSPLELVTLLLVPEIASQAILGEDFSLTNAVIALSALFSLVFISSLLRFHFGRVSRLVEGTPTVLVHDGVMFGRQMELERVSEGEIYAEMHKTGITELTEVEWVILEPDGRIAVIANKGESHSNSDDSPAL